MPNRYSSSLPTPELHRDPTRQWHGQIYTLQRLPCLWLGEWRERSVVETWDPGGAAQSEQACGRGDWEEGSISWEASGIDFPGNSKVINHFQVEPLASVF